MDCANTYSARAQSCMNAGYTIGQGECDVDSWRRCCEDCVGGAV